MEIRLCKVCREYLVLTSLFLTFLFPAYSQRPIWADSYSLNIANPGGLAVDDVGNSYFVGYSRGKLVIGGVSHDLIPTEGSFIFKVNSGGELEWVDFIINPSDERLLHVSTYKHSVYALGSYWGEKVIIQDTTLSSENLGYKMFLVKYSPDGKLIWAKGTEIDGNSSVYSHGERILHDKHGNIFVSGTVYERISSIFSKNSIQIDDVILEDEDEFSFVFKIDPNGKVLWGTKLFGGISSANPNGRLVDQLGNYIASRRKTLEYYNPEGALIETLETLPELQHPFGNSSLYLDNSGNIYSVIAEQVNFEYKLFINKYSSNRSLIRANTILSKSLPSTFEVGKENDVYLLGILDGNQDSIYFDSLVVSKSPNHLNSYIAKYNMTNGFEYIDVGSGAGIENGVTFTNIVVKDNGQFWVAGCSSGPSIFKGFSLLGRFIARFDECESEQKNLKIDLNQQQNSFCLDDTLFLSGPDGFSKYVWSTGDTTQHLNDMNPKHNYWLIVESSEGCTTQLRSDISLHDRPERPEIKEQVNDAILQCTVLANSYQWFLDGIQLPDTTRELAISSIGSYYVKAINGTCMSQESKHFSNITDTQGLKVYPNPSFGEFLITKPNILDYNISLFGIDGAQLDFQILTSDQATVKRIKINNYRGIVILRAVNMDETSYMRILSK